MIKEQRSFGFLISGVLLFIFAGIPLFRKKPVNLHLTLLAAVFLLLAFFYPVALTPLRRIWIKIGEGLGYINSRIILGSIYFLMIAPVGIVLKILKKNPIPLKFDLKANTYRFNRNSVPIEKQGMERMF